MQYIVAKKMKKSSSKAARKPTKRPLGLYRGQIWMAPDFNAPLELVEASGEMGLMPEN